MRKINLKRGDRTVVHQPSNLYGCELGDDCMVGPFVEIQEDVKIGNKLPKNY